MCLFNVACGPTNMKTGIMIIVANNNWLEKKSDLYDFSW